MNKPTPSRNPPEPSTSIKMDPGDTMDRRVAELQERFDRLQSQVRQAQQLAGLGTMAATIAHEVNNLLTPILGYAKAALQTDDVALKDKALSVTVKSVNMLVSMSDHVLQIGAAKPAHREAVSVRTAAEDAAESLCRDLSKDGIQFTVDVDPATTAWADALQLQQILFNLFINAREAMSGGHSGRLTVSATARGDETVVEIKNTGDPIPAGILDHIFEPLQTSKHPKGTAHARCGGLGLTLCRDLVKENGGTIRVTSDVETGTTFTISLPAKEPVEGRSADE